MTTTKKDTKNNENKAEEVFSTESFQVKGEKVVDKLKELFRKGNIHRVIVKNETGKVLIDIPVTVGVAGLLLLPIWVAVGAAVALATKCTIIIERRI